MKNSKSTTRAAVLFIVSCVAFFFFACILYRAQIIDTDKYKTKAATKSYTVESDAARGVIMDAGGNTLVYNEQINMLILNYLQFPTDNDEQNKEIINLIHYLESQNEKWENNLPIEISAGGIISFREDKKNELTFLKSINMLDVNPYATAEDCFSVIKEKYNLGEYSDTDAIKIAAVRYGMHKGDFSAVNSYTIARSVSMRTIAFIKENSDIFKGVDYCFSTERRYTGDGRLASHVLGVIGNINSEEYTSAKQSTAEALSNELLSEDEVKLIKLRSYGLNDKIGKTGIELAMENYLRGTKGEKTISVNSEGAITESYSMQPQTGNTVQLTINMGMQEVAEASLKKRIEAITDDETISKGLSAAGAVVVLDIKNAAVLASASYPDYSLTTYYEDFEKLSKDPGNPLWNRVTQSTYSPGSTMKPVIAVAALEEGIIDPDSYILCTGSYEYIDQKFACFNQTAHGYVNVETALEHSCNIFFYEMARQLGINRMNEYSELFGLGQLTGIEIDESKGILAGIKYRDSKGLGWKSGETLLAAIGQSDNSFSLLQLANYCATIANGGTRYTPYLVDKILTSDCTETIFTHTPVVAAETNVKKTTLDTVKKGMYLVANEGSCASILGNLRYKVACKTGTAEKSKIINGNIVNGTDGFLITFGPYEDSEIAIAVVIENAGSGSSTAQVAADIYDYYFTGMNQDATTQKENTIIW